MNRTPTKEWDVITIGDVFIDLVMSGFPAWPQPGEESFAEQLHREIGGGAAITACGLSRLGLKTALLASVGSDDSVWFRDRILSCGVSTALLHDHPSEPTGLTVSVSTSEDRAYFTYTGANKYLAEAMKTSEWILSMRNARHIHIAFPIDFHFLIDLSKDLHSAGCTISIDVGWQTSWLTDSRALDGLRSVDLFLPNEREAELISGETEPEKMLLWLVDHGISTVLKLGAKGSAMLDDGNLVRGESIPVTPVDTTGAGDCFDAGFLYGWLKEEPTEKCLRIGNLCGALSTRSLGGIDGFPKLD
ncbi:MAG: carbohydrate kinase family protein [Acidobacteria bacterium]|nr:carbohydrate kinase family protein [Acidobacteriota bacterium]